MVQKWSNVVRCVTRVTYYILNLVAPHATHSAAQAEITRNKDEITRNKDEITRNKDEITRNKDDSFLTIPYTP